MHFIIVLLFLFSESALSFIQPKITTALPRSEVTWNKAKVEQEAAAAIRSGRFDRLIHEVFDDADSNQDGSINFAECYELVLKLYVNINRQAPIPPPSRRVVHRLFVKSDRNRNNRVSLEEFRALAKTLGRRALTRVAAHKIMTWLVAPLLAEYVVRQLTYFKWLERVARQIVPVQYESRVLPTITSPNFYRTILMVVFMATLGNIFIAAINTFLDESLPEDKSDERSFYR